MTTGPNAPAPPEFQPLTHEQQVKIGRRLRRIADLVDKELRKAAGTVVGFSLLTWGAGRTQYVSNSRRDDTRTAMKELVERWDEDHDLGIPETGDWTGQPPNDELSADRITAATRAAFQAAESLLAHAGTLEAIGLERDRLQGSETNPDPRHPSNSPLHDAAAAACTFIRAINDAQQALVDRSQPE